MDNSGTVPYANRVFTDFFGPNVDASASCYINHVLYQWDSSRDYNPSAGLERIEAVVLAINSADDERNPPETGVMEREIKRVKHGRVLLLPGSPDTAGHGTTAQAIGLCEIVARSRKCDDLNVEPVRDSALCAQHALHGSQLDDRVHIRVGAHARYAVRDRMFEEPRCPHPHVCGRESGPRLCRGVSGIGQGNRTK